MYTQNPLTTPALRSLIRSRRRNLNQQAQSQAALDARDNLSPHKWFKTAKHIAFYWPNDGELNPVPLLLLALKMGKICYLPIITPHKKTMIFRRYKKGDRLKLNRYGIREPEPKSRPKSIRSMDLVLMPLVAFDLSGNRVGMGGGYYDRELAKTTNIKPVKIGLAHSFQQVEKLEPNQWDIPMQGIATEKRFISVRFSAII